MYDDTQRLLEEIGAGADTFLELKEVVFQDDKVRLARLQQQSAQLVLAEVFVTMANTADGVVMLGVADAGTIVGVDPARRELLEQFVVNASRDLCVPPIDPLLDWLHLPDADGEPRLCLKVTVLRSVYAVHCTAEGRYLKRVGTHRRVIPTEELQRLLATRNLVAPYEEWPAFGATLTDVWRSGTPGHSTTPSSRRTCTSAASP